MVKLKFVGRGDGYFPGLGANEDKEVRNEEAEAYLVTGWWVKEEAEEALIDDGPVEEKAITKAKAKQSNFDTAQKESN